MRSLWFEVKYGLEKHSFEVKYGLEKYGEAMTPLMFSSVC